MRKIFSAVLLLALSSFALADYCFTSVEDLNSCRIEDLIATKKAMNSISKFSADKKTIQTITLNRDPRDMLKFVLPGSPAHKQVLEDIKYYVPTTTYSVFFHLEGDFYTRQLRPESNCAYFGKYRETEDIIEFDHQKLIGDCSDLERKWSELVLGKSTYRKIKY